MVFLPIPNENTIKEITYDSYGNILKDTNKEFKVPFGFAGGLHDRETNLVHFGYREYDPYTGKWTAKDPIDTLVVRIITFNSYKLTSHLVFLH